VLNVLHARRPHSLGIPDLAGSEGPPLALLGPVARSVVAPLSGQERTLSGRINQTDL
jgi:hypothetical protein